MGWILEMYKDQAHISLLTLQFLNIFSYSLCSLTQREDISLPIVGQETSVWDICQVTDWHVLHREDWLLILHTGTWQNAAALRLIYTISFKYLQNN